MIQKIFSSNKFCSFALSIHLECKKKRLTKNIKQRNYFNIDINKKCLVITAENSAWPLQE